MLLWTGKLKRLGKYFKMLDQQRCMKREELGYCCIWRAEIAQWVMDQNILSDIYVKLLVDFQAKATGSQPLQVSIIAK